MKMILSAIFGATIALGSIFFLDVLRKIDVKIKPIEGPPQLKSLDKQEKDSIDATTGRPDPRLIPEISVGMDPPKEISSDINKNLFSSVIRASMDIESSLSIGASFKEFSIKIKQQKTEIDLCLISLKTDKEKEILSIFQEVSFLYYDSLILWNEYIDANEVLEIIPMRKKDIQKIVIDRNLNVYKNGNKLTKEEMNHMDAECFTPKTSLNILWRKAKELRIAATDLLVS